MSDLIQVTDEDFEKEVLNSSLPVLVDFWADWCGPCKLIAPLIEELSTEYAGRVKVCKLDVDENPSTASRYGVMGIPTLIFFKGGGAVDRIVGVVPKEEIIKRFDRMLLEKTEE